MLTITFKKTRKIRYYLFEVLPSFTLFLYFVPNILATFVVFAFGTKIKSSLNPLFFNALKYIGVAFRKISLLDDR